MDIHDVYIITVAYFHSIVQVLYYSGCLNTGITRAILAHRLPWLHCLFSKTTGGERQMRPGVWQKAAAPPSRAGSAASHRALSPRDGGSHLRLGRSSGPTSAGAWAARWEVASLLEARCSPEDLVRMIRSGREGTRPLNMNGSIEVDQVEGDECESTVPSPSASLDHGDLESEIAKQKAILESLGAADSMTPPWEVKRETEPPSPGRWGPSSLSSLGSQVSGDKAPVVSQQSLEKGFRKRAQPPSKAALNRIKGDASPEIAKPKSDEIPVFFDKRAKPPSDRSRTNEPSKGFKGAIPTGRPTDLASKELAELEKFGKKALNLYRKFDDYGVKMDLAELVEDEKGYVDNERFKIHTMPNRAATGLRYARLMEAHFRWLKAVDNPFEGRENAFEKLGVLGFLEYVIHRKAGARTPQGILYAVDFFGKALGFDVNGSHFNRARRLALRYSQMAKKERCGAPMFSRVTLVALERILLDEDAPLNYRVTAGKLRLCVQASIRHSDLNFTPISSCEWIRRRGEVTVVGLRARAVRGKTGPRAWVASILGADEQNDQWLPTLMRLMLQAHGPGFDVHDHFGRLPDASGHGFHSHPSSLEADVVVVKTVLSKAVSKGEEVGLSMEQVETLRWHSAKATLTSVMQHLGLSSKTIRFSGDWKDSKEAMPDLYLREAQLMVLRGQERALAYLRRGGDVGGLIGEPVFKEIPKDGKSGVDLKSCDTAMVDEILGEFSKNPIHCAAEFLDEVLKGTHDLPDLEMLEKERATSVCAETASECLRDVSESEVEEPAGEDKASSLKKEQEISENESDDVEEDFEGMVSAFVQVKRPTQASKIHRNKDRDQEDLYDKIAQPLCGAKGSYDYIQASEAMDSELCVRRFGRTTGCSYLCGKVKARPGCPVRRCARRCVCQGSHSEHRCHMHAFEENV